MSKLMLSDIDTASPFSTRCGPVLGKCIPSPGRSLVVKASACRSGLPLRLPEKIVLADFT